MGAFSRNKGAANERAVVMALRELGFENVRRGLCQEQRKGFRPDVIGELNGKVWTFESKAYQSKFYWLYKYLRTISPSPDGAFRIVCLDGDTHGCVALAYDPRLILTCGVDKPFTAVAPTKEFKRLVRLQDLKKEADILALRSSRQKRLYIRYWDANQVS